jgi:hypothetical protein
MWCQGDIAGCDADEVLCACGVLRCVVHGHVDEGDDPYCRDRLDVLYDETDGRGYDELDLSRWPGDSAWPTPG